jgi:hypothetical protein
VVVLSAPIAIVDANRVRGGGRASIAITTVKVGGSDRPAAVVGNITTAPITLFNNPLQDPWKPLNLRF